MRLVFTAAVMDLLHEGHLNLLKSMRESGDLTLVVLHDGFTTFKNKHRLPIENLEKRTRNLIDTGLVDIIRFTFSESPSMEFREIIDRFQPQFDLIFMRGDDWRDFPGRSVLERADIPIVQIPYTVGASSSKLRLEL
jgi:cytidyltransferase-like protein